MVQAHIRKIGFGVGILFASLIVSPAFAQETQQDSIPEKEKKEVVALKNNLVYDAAATPNLQLEVLLARRWTLEFGVGFNPFPLDDNKNPKWRHLSVSVAPRYWFCNAFHRDFISFNAGYAHFNVAGNAYPVAWMYPQVRDTRYQGDAVMAGASYGYHFAISPHFSIELEGGIDGGYAWFGEYECRHCGEKKRSGGRWFILPKLGVNIVVPLGGDEASLARRCDCEQIDDTTSSEPAPEPIMPREQIKRLTVPLTTEMQALKPAVPFFTPKVDDMQRLRNRLLRSAEEYEPYNSAMALSADPRNVFLFFDVNVTKMDRNFIQNDMLMDSIMHILGDALADSALHVRHIQIVGFASFDGRQNYNVRLAGERARTIKEYMQSVYPELPDSVFAVCNGGESWAELQYQLEQLMKTHPEEASLHGIEQVLAAIKYEPDPDKREALIKRLDGGDTYRYMRDELRHILRNLGCITIYVEY